MTTPVFVWQLGDPWRDLTNEIHNTGLVAVVTDSGTVHLIDVMGGRQCRLSATNPMPNDQRWRSLAHLEVTPCGAFTVTDIGDWHLTTPLLAVINGHDPAGITEDHLSRGAANMGGHPPEACVGLYCPFREAI